MKDDTYVYRPKLSFDITEEQQERANKYLNTHGIRKAIFHVILDDLLDLIEKQGPMVIGVILSKAMKTDDLLPSMREAREKSK